MAARARGQRQFGNIRRLPSGRYQARYYGPDGVRHSATTTDGRPLTFETKADADEWLSTQHTDIVRRQWRPVAPPATTEADRLTLCAYATEWLADRELAVTTRHHYEQLLRDHILPTLGDLGLDSITPTTVRKWHAKVAPGTPTARAHAYGLLRTILHTAVTDELTNGNPCRIRGGRASKRVKKIRPASLEELETLVASMPPRYRVMVLLAAWCALRFGELAELRRADVDVDRGVLSVQRGVTTQGGLTVKGPKSEAGKREVHIPPHLAKQVKAHLRDHAQVGRDGLVFPAASGRHMRPSSLYKVYYPAREKAGRSDLRFHDLRHTGATRAAQTGATLIDVMARLGHSTPGAAMRYQHAAAENDKAIAKALSAMAAPKRSRKNKKRPSRKSEEAA
jgi:integrase